VSAVPQVLDELNLAVSLMNAASQRVEQVGAVRAVLQGRCLTATMPAALDCMQLAHSLAFYLPETSPIFRWSKCATS